MVSEQLPIDPPFPPAEATPLPPITADLYCRCFLGPKLKAVVRLFDSPIPEIRFILETHSLFNKGKRHSRLVFVCFETGSHSVALTSPEPSL